MRKFVVLGGFGGVVLVSFLFLGLVSSQAFSEDCVIPFDGLIITEDTVFCSEGPGTTYFISDEYHDGLIQIGAPGIILNCDHATLNGVDDNQSIAISNMGHDNVTIKNCNITGYNEGIRITEAFGNIITGNNTSKMVKGPGGFSAGIRTIQSSNTLIYDNVTNNNDDGDGILVDEISSGNEIYNNTALYNGRFGIIIEYGSHDNEIHDNYSSFNRQGYSASMNSYDNNFHHNIADSNELGNFDMTGNDSGIGLANAINNNTIIRGGSGISLNANPLDTVITNNIIYNNGVGIFKCSACTISDISYNDVYRNGRNYMGLSDQEGTNGNISKDPLMKRDYHLRLASPCIDAGDPHDAYSDEPEPNGGRINMGAYGNTSEAATTPDCLVPTKGMKINRDITFCPEKYSFDLRPWQGALRVESDDITITCQDTTITDSLGQGIGLKIYRHNNVVVQGCNFQNLNFGMKVKGGSNVGLINVELKNNKLGVQFTDTEQGLIQYSEIWDNEFIDIAVINEDLTIDQATSDYDPVIFASGAEVIVE